MAAGPASPHHSSAAMSLGSRDIELERQLSEIGGLALRGAARAADMQMFEFGPLVSDVAARSGTDIGAIGLHVQCPWRIRLDGQILVASGDLEIPTSSTPLDSDAFDPNEIGTTLRDERIDEFLAGEPRMVTDVEASVSGDLAIRFGERFTLEVFVERSWDSREPRESWRLLFIDSDRPHIVMTSLGLEIA